MEMKQSGHACVSIASSSSSHGVLVMSNQKHSCPGKAMMVRDSAGLISMRFMRAYCLALTVRYMDPGLSGKHALLSHRNAISSRIAMLT
ncbi:unnamed protein product [Chrysoparadoxa australica]